MAREPREIVVVARIPKLGMRVVNLNLAPSTTVLDEIRHTLNEDAKIILAMPRASAEKYPIAEWCAG